MRSGYRFIILICAVIMQACLGATYSWSLFAGALHDHTGIELATAQLPFTAFYIAFPATMIASGIMLRRLGLRGCAVLGGLVFGCGWMFASLGSVHISLTVVGIGLLGGIGVGLAYVVPIAVGMRWFPHNKGLVTGVIVAGFGGGAAMVAFLAEGLMARGATPFEVFGILGLCFAVLVMIAGSMMRQPDRKSDQVETGRSTDDLHWSKVIYSPTFALLYLAMFAGLAAGFSVAANLKQLCPMLDSKAGALAVGIFAVANAAGRVSWGYAFDRLFSTAAIRFNLLAQAALLVAAPWLIRSPAGLQVLAALAGFNYGGVLVLYASATAHKWGAERVGRIYGWLFSANIPASLAPALAAFIYGRTETFTPTLLVLAAILLVAACKPAMRPENCDIPAPLPAARG